MAEVYIVSKTQTVLCEHVVVHKFPIKGKTAEMQLGHSEGITMASNESGTAV